MRPDIYLLNTRLNQAEIISFVTDIWTNTIMADFLGLIAYVTFEFGFSEIFVIGIAKFKDKHESENIQKAIELIVNQYYFDRKQIICNYKSNNLIFYYLKSNCLRPRH